jgi:hypothetical protein
MYKICCFDQFQLLPRIYQIFDQKSNFIIAHGPTARPTKKAKQAKAQRESNST